MHTHKSGVLAPSYCPFPGKTNAPALSRRCQLAASASAERATAHHVNGDARDWSGGRLSAIARDVSAAGAHADHGRARGGSTHRLRWEPSQASRAAGNTRDCSHQRAALC